VSATARGATAAGRMMAMTAIVDDAEVSPLLYYYCSDIHKQSWLTFVCLFTCLKLMKEGATGPFWRFDRGRGNQQVFAVVQPPTIYLRGHHEGTELNLDITYM
jgi:hypothetical protein